MNCVKLVENSPQPACERDIYQLTPYTEVREEKKEGSGKFIIRLFFLSGRYNIKEQVCKSKECLALNAHFIFSSSCSIWFMTLQVSLPTWVDS
jgi:hypothetical protein